MAGWPRRTKFYNEGDEIVDDLGATFKRINGSWIMIKDKYGNPVEQKNAG